ncbi:MAG: aldehyde dehydrogenase family protein [Saprospiraceae bacterium]|nr:aldehyde dehydrogenase family protein [Saprospiraceae bacterium]
MIQSHFEKLLGSFNKNPYTSGKERKDGLQRLKANILKNRTAIQEALFKDLGKSQFEADTNEILVVLRELNNAINNLHYWMQNKSVSTDILLFGTSSFIRFEPKSVVALISPWNYPFNLTMSPLIAAYAAGNKIMVKPSEYSPATSLVIKSIIEESFTNEEVICELGDAEFSAELCKLPFSFIFFTGGKSIAKKVLNSASANLTPCVLELGGKSPVIIDDQVNLEKVVKHIAFAKTLNAGQTCIAPDFIAIRENQIDQFILLWNKWIEDTYGSKIIESTIYSKIVNEKHYKRIENFIEGACQEGAVLPNEVSKNSTELKIGPVLLTNISWESKIMEDEIFGPILPLLTYNDEDELILKLQKYQRPLSLYIFSNRKTFIDKIILNTRSGGVTINQCLLNYVESNLPFGGDWHSGTGKYHGKYGFLEFSHQRSISRQGILPSTLELFHPPFTKFKILIKNILFKIYS